MEYSTTGSPLKAMSIDPNKELFDSSSPPTSSPPPTPNDDIATGRWRAEANAEAAGGGADDGGSTLHLSVTDPQQIGEGRGAHTYYRIDVRQGQFNADPIASVRRRYSDFQWLFQRLHAEKPGAVVPLIPHTQAVQLSKRLGEELIEERRVHLERFLRRVQVHPELEGAPSLAAFFSPDAEVFEAAKKANPGNAVDDIGDEQAGPAQSAKEKVKHFFVKQTLKVKVARGEILEETPDGARMEEVEQYLATLENNVKALSKATLYLVNVSKESSTTMHELGQSLFGLHQTFDPATNANSEEENIAPAADAARKPTHLPSIKAISNVFASLSAINKVKHDENQSKVGAHIDQLGWSIQAARLAVRRRRNGQLTYNTYVQQVKNREVAVDKLARQADLSSQPAGYDERIAAAQNLLDDSRRAAAKARDELDAVTRRVFREMDRFKRQMDEELRQLYVNHARVQVDYSPQMDGEWKKLVATKGGGGGGGAGPRGGAGSNGASPGGSTEAETLMI